MRHQRDLFEICGALALIALGVWFMNHALAEYSFGTLRRMGPGFFPAVLGGLVAAFGILILLPAVLRRAAPPEFDLRAFLFLSAGLLGFSLALERFGLVPATFVLVFLAALGRRGIRPVETGVLAAALAVIGVLLFSRGLGIPLDPFRWSV